MSSGPLLFELDDPLRPSDLPELCRLACRELAIGSHRLLEVDVGRVPADAVAVDAIARLARAARRHGCEVRLRGADSSLWQLLELSGLSDVVRQ
jgi:ABC-type transporter Mla MlaB component